MNIIIASDHAGFELKQEIIDNFIKEHNFTDIGTHDDASCDYPDFAYDASNLFSQNNHQFIILICGSGIGISIAANRDKNIRAALCTNTEMAKLSRQHNDANCLCLGSRITPKQDAFLIVKEFLSANFDKENKRHKNRVEKLC